MIGCIKLKTGEEIIAQFEPEDLKNTSVTVRKARALELVDTEEGLTVDILPYALGNIDTNIELDRKDILTSYIPHPDMELAYTKDVLGKHISATFGV